MASLAEEGGRISNEIILTTPDPTPSWNDLAIRNPGISAETRKRLRNKRKRRVKGKRG